LGVELAIWGEVRSRLSETRKFSVKRLVENRRPAAEKRCGMTVDPTGPGRTSGPQACCIARRAAEPPGTPVKLARYRGGDGTGHRGLEEANMPIFLLWAIPAIVVVGGGTYMLFMR
jgi:hypothetical protein